MRLIRSGSLQVAASFEYDQRKLLDKFELSTGGRQTSAVFKQQVFERNAEVEASSDALEDRVFLCFLNFLFLSYTESVKINQLIRTHCTDPVHRHLPKIMVIFY